MSSLGGLRAIAASRATGALIRSVPNFPKIKLLLHGEGTLGSQVYTDSSSFTRSIPPASGVTLSSVEVYRGSSSVRFDGTSGLEVNPSFQEEWTRLGSARHPVTIEVSLFLGPSSNRRFLVGTDVWGFSIAPKSDGISYHSNGSIETTFTTSTLLGGGFIVLALQMEEDYTAKGKRRIHLWANGLYQGSLLTDHRTQLFDNLSDTASKLRIGGDASGNFLGYIDELRISEDVFLPLANYSVAGGSFPDVAGPVTLSGGYGRGSSRRVFTIGVTSQETFGGVVVALSEIRSAGIPGGAVGTTSVLPIINPAGITSAEVLGTITLNQGFFSVGGIAPGIVVGPKLSAGVNLSAIPSAEALGSLNFTPVGVVLAGIASSEGVGSLTVAPPLTLNPAFSNVKLLLHGEGTNGTQTYTDNSLFTRSLVGSSAVVVDTSRAYRGAASLNMTGAVNFQIPVAVGDPNEFERLGTDSNPLTIEHALWQATGSGSQRLLCAPMQTGGAFQWLSFSMDTGNTGIVMDYNGVSASVPFLSSYPFDTFTMIAIEVRGSTSHEMGVWVDGVWQGSVVSSDTITSHTFTFGETSNGDNNYNFGRRGGSGQFIGGIDELRISKESFLPWGSNYSVQATEFPNDPNLAFLTSSGIDFSNGNRTAVTSVASGGWSVIPVSVPVPTTGKWYVEFDTTGLSGHQMFGATMASSPFVGRFLGESSSPVSEISQGDGSRSVGSVFNWADSTAVPSFGTSSIGLSIDQATGDLRWYSNGTLQPTDATFTPGTSGIYFAVGSYFGRGPITLKIPAGATIPSGFTYLT